MTSIALKGLLSRKLRSVLTAIAIVLGVALMSGTFVLTDSITRAFDSIFQTIYRGTDATITGRSAVTSPPGDSSQPSSPWRTGSRLATATTGGRGASV